MSDNQTPKYSAAELADTGRWHLVVRIGDKSAEAWLNYIADNSRPNRLFAIDFDDSETHIEQLERAVYDNPRVLDDFSTDVIIDTDRVLWTPKSANDPETVHLMADTLWPDLANDVLTDRTGTEVCHFALTPGLATCMQRTFPGARVVCGLSVLRRFVATRHSEGTILYVDFSDKAMIHILATQADKLLFASTKPSEYYDVPALVQLITNSLKACGCERSEIQATINSDASDTTRHTVASRLGAALEPYVAECTYTDTAARLGTDGIPLALALSATRRNTTQ
ncbi:MAG: DUF3822 family protein [Muribaculaceae bacterium]|nr:DUF3822 family protein [Muribaculaceae bacterium]